ncbi:hypothetical protein K443DRAFT_542775 [Laccaria amethystina LaAM-08-1]|uniref:Uncharacterized protein n=1 Tax=Laccaria amethystina LaAM-08-1 TaxID=1095629 RepID=A0A0C9XKP1_9AGAR|nr:hypothetical protein K443DRAFT_542775 [Laccaria amethystina LaAM-08-1]
MQTTNHVNIEDFLHEVQLYNQPNGHPLSYPSPRPIRTDFQYQHPQRNTFFGCQLRTNLSDPFHLLPFSQE